MFDKINPELLKVLVKKGCFVGSTQTVSRLKTCTGPTEKRTENEQKSEAHNASRSMGASLQAKIEGTKPVDTQVSVLSRVTLFAEFAPRFWADRTWIQMRYFLQSRP